MQTLKNLLFVSIFILWVELPPAMLDGKGGKRGFCPIDRCRCTGQITVRCKDDYTCDGNYKCCMDCCQMKCMPPRKERPGMCPRDPFVCVKAGIDRCQYDIDCANAQKCCYNSCAKHCVNPV